MAFRISDEQIEALSVAQTERFYDRVVAFVTEHVPEEATVHGPDRLREQLPAFHAECRDLGLESERSIAFLFSACLTLHRNVLHDPSVVRRLRGDGPEPMRLDAAINVLGQG